LSPIVSILIPAYNSEKWVGQTIRSAIQQTWPKKEIIVVDDGSSDNTLTVAKSFESKIVKVITQKNSGACSARNKALSFAQGAYIQWLDADDLLDPDKISQTIKQIDADQNSRIVFTSSFGTFFFRHQKAKFNPNSLWKDLKPVEWIMIKFNENAWMNPASWLVSRKLTEEAGTWDERLSTSGDDDGEYICRIVARSEKVKFVKDAKSYYREGNYGSLSGRRSDTAFESLVLSTQLSIEHLLSLEDSEKTRTACLMLLENRLWHFYPDKKELIKKLEAIAQTIGGNMLELRETRKYLFIGKYFGFNTAKRLRNIIYKSKKNIQKNVDKIFYKFLDK
jgi:glycosyltransferase involved in cell wall biosynthesis